LLATGLLLLGCPSRIDPPPRTGDGPSVASSPVPSSTAPVADDTGDAPGPGPEPEPFVVSSRPVVLALQRAFAGTTATDRPVGGELFAPDLQWLAPLRDAQPRGLDDVLAGLTGRSRLIERVLDLGRSLVVVQVDDPRGGAVLLLEIVDERVAGVREYGSGLLDAPPLPSAATRAPTPVVEGPPHVRNVAITRKLYDAANARQWQVFSEFVAAAATHRDESDAASLQDGLAALLADPVRRLTIRRHFSCRGYVVVEALVDEPHGAVRRPVAAFVDVLRLDHQQVVSSRRYLNLRRAD
jgi:hypothetical protein